MSSNVNYSIKYHHWIFKVLFSSVWGPPLSDQDFFNGKKVQPVTMTDKTRRAIRAGIQSEVFNAGKQQNIL
jgi:hypothetical protein